MHGDRPARAAIVNTRPPAAEAASPGLDILVLLPRFGSGGASRVACTLAGPLRCEGLSVAVATIGPADGITRSLLDPAVRTISLAGFKGAGRGLLASALALPSLILAIRSRTPGVLMSAGNHANLFAAVGHWLAAAPRTGLAIKITNPIVRANRARLRTWVKRQLYRWMVARASSVLVLSPEDGAGIAALCPAAAGKTRVVANPYLGPSAPQAPAPATDPPLVLAVGRLTEQKNFELLLTAMARLQDRPWRLRVLGQGKRLASLQALAGRLGMADKVEFLGYVADPSPHYRSARVLAISSMWEGLPAVAIEALAAGCAVVTTDSSPALSRIVRAAGSGEVTAACPDAFAKALAAALDRPRPAGPPACVLDYTFERAALSHVRALAPLLRAASLWRAGSEPAPDARAPAAAASRPLRAQRGS